MSTALRSLIDAARSGDRKALDELAACTDRFVRMFSGSLSAQVRRVHGSTVDFVLEGLAQALASLDEFRYESDEHFYAWVTRTIRSRIFDAWRRESRKKRGRPVSLEGAEIDPAAGDPAASKVAADAELREEVAKAVLELQIEHPQAMEVVVLKLFEDESWPSITAILGLSSDRRARTLFANGVDLLRPRVQRLVDGSALGGRIGD